MTGSCSSKVLMTHIFVLMSFSRGQKASVRLLQQKKVFAFAKKSNLSAILYFWPRFSTGSWWHWKLIYNPKPEFLCQVMHEKLRNAHLHHMIRFCRAAWCAALQHGSRRQHVTCCFAAWCIALPHDAQVRCLIPGSAMWCAASPRDARLRRLMRGILVKKIKIAAKINKKFLTRQIRCKFYWFLLANHKCTFILWNC